MISYMLFLNLSSISFIQTEKLQGLEAVDYCVSILGISGSVQQHLLQKLHVQL